LDDFWEYIINDLQNMEFRIEDIILHSLTGVIVTILLRIKKIFQSLKNFFK